MSGELTGREVVIVRRTLVVEYEIPAEQYRREGEPLTVDSVVRYEGEDSGDPSVYLDNDSDETVEVRVWDPEANREATA